MTETITPSPFQNLVLAAPPDLSLGLFGGRGSGKSVAVQLLLLRTGEQFPGSRSLVVRTTVTSLKEFEDEFSELMLKVYGRAARFNRNDHIVYLPNGSVVEFGSLDGPSAAGRLQGRNFQLIVFEEAGLYKSPEWKKLFASLRGPSHIPRRAVIVGNPGGPNHAELLRDYVSQGAHGAIYSRPDGTKWTNLFSTYLDNPTLNHEEYRQRLIAATHGNKALEAAWLEGSFEAVSGSYFADVFAPNEVIAADWRPHRDYPLRRWKTFWALDWGQAAPTVAYLCARVPNGYPGLPATSLILWDEYSTAWPDDLNAGRGFPPSKVASDLLDMADRWGLRTHTGTADDAYGIDERLLDAFRRHGLSFIPPKKGRGSRVAGWSLLRARLNAAKTRNGEPGLWMTARCKYLLATLPFHPRDEMNPEDLDTTGPDHGLDAARYAATYASRAPARSGRHEGMY